MQYPTRTPAVVEKEVVLGDLIKRIPERLSTNGEAFTPTIKGLECIRDSLSPSDGLLSAERMSMACIRAAPYVKAFLCAIALKSRRHVVVVDPHSAEAFPARGLRPSTPNVVFVPFYIRHSHNKAVDVHDYAFPDGRWVLGLYDVDANASFCFDPACPLAEPDPNEFPAFESTLRLLNLPASTFKTRESVRLQHSDSENSGFHVCIFASNYLKTGRVGESTMSLEILRNFVLSTYQYVMEPAETKDLLTDLDALSISDAPPSSKKFAPDPINMYPHGESTSPAG
ncbi:hypothetical protein AAVH_09058 [Aphelenchoides avenae]|nr:hypothetical protein AAVH_09058 [Aphelenchus avenae]